MSLQTPTIIRVLQRKLYREAKEIRTSGSMSGEIERERILVNGRDLPRMRHEELAEAIVLSPALQGFHTVFRLDRLPVVPSKALAQRERVFHAVRGHGRPIDHLRFNLKVLVRAEEGIVH
jgi:hypothetical protein